MQLVLRKLPAKDTFISRLAAWAIKTRLVSEYCHGGIVVGNLLFHSTASRGLHASCFEPEKWDLFVVPDKFDVMAMYYEYMHTPYDFFSLLAFITPWRAVDGSKMYCYEWCYLAMTGVMPDFRVTPETLLKLIGDTK